MTRSLFPTLATALCFAILAVIATTWPPEARGHEQSVLVHATIVQKAEQKAPAQKPAPDPQPTQKAEQKCQGAACQKAAAGRPFFRWLHRLF